MDTRTQLENSLKDAMRAGDEVAKRTIRMSLAAIKQAEIDRQIKLDETGVINIIQKEVKIRRESLEEAEQANRLDLAEETRAEIDLLSTFLPKGLSLEELRTLARGVISEVGAASLADMGSVMKVMMGRVKGRAPGDQVSQVVRELLQE